MDRTSQRKRTPEADDGGCVGVDGNDVQDSQRAMIRMLLRQTPEERLRGLANAARFFANAHRG